MSISIYTFIYRLNRSRSEHIYKKKINNKYFLIAIYKPFVDSVDQPFFLFFYFQHSNINNVVITRPEASTLPASAPPALCTHTEDQTLVSQEKSQTHQHSTTEVGRHYSFLYYLNT